MIQAKKFRSLDGAISYPQEKQYSRSKSHTTEKLCFSELSNSSRDKPKVTKSLPHMYNMTSSPTVDEGDVWR